jgi:glycosyltransferase involved in cell wall biosynthesis
MAERSPAIAEPRRINAATLRVERPDLLIHAVAQLGDNVTLELPGDVPHRAELALLARGYGISERISFEGSSEPARVQQGPTTMAGLIHELSDAGDPPAACRDRDQIFAGHRVAIVTNLPAPYRLPLLSKMSGRLKHAGAELRVLFAGSRARGRPWIGVSPEIDFAYESLSSFELPIGGRRTLLPTNLERRLSAFRPTIIVAAGFSPLVSTRAARFARRHGALFGIWSGEIAGRSTSANRLRRAQRRRLALKGDFGIAYGFLAGEYLRDLCPSMPFVYGRNTSGTHAREQKPGERPGTVQLLAVADMAKPGKGIEVLVDALKELPSLPCVLTVVGPGAAAAGLEERAQPDARINFVGALPQAEVRKRYAESDVFLFPSSAEADPFGLALIEAMGSSLAPVVSNTPGAVADVGVDGWNCIVVREHSAPLWADAVKRVVLDQDLRLSLQRNAAMTIGNRWTMDHACDSMIAGLRLGLLRAERQPPLKEASASTRETGAVA